MRLPLASSSGRLPIEAACRILTGYGSGSGFLVRADGLVATCAHGVYEDAPVRVELADQTLHNGRVVAFRPERDLALIQIEDVYGLPTVRLGNPRDLPLGTRLHVVGFDQLPESTNVSIYLPVGNRYGTVVGPTALEVGLAAMLRVSALEDDVAFDCALTTRTAQVRPGSSGAMVCAPDGTVVGVHTAAIDLGGFGQEISAVELQKLISEHPKGTAGKRGGRTDGATRKRWERAWYALQCIELERQGSERDAESYRYDLERLGDGPSEDADVYAARAVAYRHLEEWPEAVREAQASVAFGDSRGLGTLRKAAAHVDPGPLLRFLEAQIEAMSEPERRLRLREVHLGILLDRELFSEAADWGAKGEGDAREARDAARFLFDYARALHALGRQEEADTWLHRAVWEPGGRDLPETEISKIAIDSAEPRTRWYGLRKGLSSLISGEAGTSTLEPLRRVTEAQGATEAAAFFASLAHAFEGTLVGSTSEDEEVHEKSTEPESPDGEPPSDPCDDKAVDPLAE